MLRASIETSDYEADFKDVAGASTGDASPVPGAGALVELVESALDPNAADGEAARERVRRELGFEALVDAAGIIGNFERMNRIADATGISLDAPLNVATESFRAELGIDRYGSAKNTQAVKSWQRTLWRLIEPIARTVLRRAGRRARSKADPSITEGTRGS